MITHSFSDYLLCGFINLAGSLLLYDNDPHSWLFQKMLALKCANKIKGFIFYWNL